MSANNISVSIGPNTEFIVSTSGRLSSLRRYRALLNRVLNLDAVYIPLTNHAKGKVDPQRFSLALRGMPCIGGAISKDIKHSIIPFLDEVDEDAVKIGSVNTVVVRKGALKGYNTDALGFERAIIEGISSAAIGPVHSAICYGYGGVASVVTTVLAKMGITVYLTGRNEKSIISRANELNVQAWSNEQCDLFINATPASERPLEEADNFLPAITGCKIAFDHEMPGVYLAEYCSANNIYHIKGTAMYYPQMYAQWSLFLDGIVPSVEKNIATWIQIAENLSAEEEEAEAVAVKAENMKNIS